MTSELSSGSHIEGFLGKATSRLRARTGADLVLGGRVDPDTGRVAILCADGAQTDAFEGLSALPKQGISGRVVALGRHVEVKAGRPIGAYAGLGDGAGVPIWTDCREDIRSVLAIPLRFEGRVAFVLYVATRSESPISVRTAKSALAFIGRLEAFIAEIGGAHLRGEAPRSSLDVRVLYQIDDELEKIVGQVDSPIVRQSVEIIRNLLDESLLAVPAAEEETVVLTRRERDVLRLVAQGLSNAETARRLFVSTETVKAYLRSVRSKLGVNNRTAAVSVARQAGLL
ncbi:response regulator transcription factor [Frankia sp. CNm7]|uniref:Response regulator transcription factor n=1 Tax=Frankia nepalensis TaxID=1836974 RepID=A0A937RLW7_9ACTN|nr:response regulator transcription factor [Frankia nepalensis]MBL7498799.1 response regulator transcription factor [Frankia nepalensis]MBL7508604.1 response regulator transcription factor [Frankia nepalensis]MBL7517478.1 response regulator transcription factor [Frankia nepalensis]MBL7629724.1 response regulator transcription factor [Frankia nepalensis]